MPGWSVLARDQQTEQQWIQEFKAYQRSGGTALGNEVSSAREVLHSMVLIDMQCSDWREWIKTADRKNKTFILVVDEGATLPSGKDLKLVDDIMVYPFRIAELLSHYRHHHEKSDIDAVIHEVEQSKQEIKNVNDTLERILQARTPQRFTGIKGIAVNSRHLSGLKPGGDYFDVFESEKKDFVNILLADSSSYGLSSALLGMILSSSARIASDANMSISRWIKAIYEELKISLGESEHLSVFFGRLNRRDFSLHYQMYGTVEAFLIDQAGTAKRLEKQGGRILSGFTHSEEESVISLNPKDRLVLLSDGFVNGVGGESNLNKLFLDKQNQDPFAVISELSYQIKSKLSPGETFPGEDCSAIIIDIEKRVLRLAPTG